MNMLRFISRNLYNKNQAKLFYGVAIARRCLLTQQYAQSVSHDEHCLVVKWNDGNVDQFPYLYLRENCRCPECFQDVRKARTMFAPKLINLDIAAESADWNPDNDQLSVKWQDGHSSVYPSQFLRRLRYKNPGEGHPPGVLRKGIETWGRNFSEEGKLPTFDFEKLLTDDHELYNWLVTLATQTGLAKLQNVPTKSNQMQLLGDKVGYLMSTNYGFNYDIKAYSDDEASDVGYTSGDLPVHSDYTFCHTSPAVAMLHCIEQTETEGGVNHWVDAFHVAQLLYEEDPESFHILTQAPVAFRNIAKTAVDLFHTSSRRRILSLDDDKKVTAVCYSDEFRDAHMPLAPKVMKSFYRAYFRFSELLDDTRTSFWYKMKAGEAMTMNNHRVLHGRSAYTDNDTNTRLLQLAYFDWDCVHSKIRLLAKKQGIDSPLD